MMAPAQDKRVWLAGGAALAVVLVAVGWLAFINPELSSRSSLRGEAAAVSAQNSVLSTKVAKLKQQNDNIGQLRADLRRALAALPSDTGLPAFTRQLANQATRNDVTLTSITVGSITGSTATGTPATTSSGAVPSPTTSSGATPSASATPAPPAVVTIPITLLSSGSSQHQLAFLKAIQVTGPRRALVTSTTLGAGTAAGGASIDKSAVMTTQITIFSAPLDAATRAQLAKLLKAK